MNPEVSLRVLILVGLTLGLVLGGVLAWTLGRRIETTNPPAKRTVLARTAMWLAIAAAVGLLVGVQAVPAIFGMLTDWLNLDLDIATMLAVIPGGLAYVAATAAIVMSLTALARRDRSGATWTGLIVAGIPFALITVDFVTFFFHLW